MAELSENGELDRASASDNQDEDIKAHTKHENDGYSSDSSSSSSSSSSSNSSADQSLSEPEQKETEETKPTEEIETEAVETAATEKVENETEEAEIREDSPIVEQTTIDKPSEEVHPVPSSPASFDEVSSKHSSRKSSTSSSSSSSSSDSEPEHKPQPKSPEPAPKVPSPPLTSPKLMPSIVEPAQTSVDEEAKLLKKVQITDEPATRPKAAHPKSARFSERNGSPEMEPVSSELHVVRYRNTRSAPVRSRGFHAQSSNLVFLQKECERIERKMAKAAKANLVNRPKIAPYKPFTWNSLAPYYNTDTLRYMIQMPVNVRRGYNTRATASGLVDPEISWKMDHCLTPVTPSRPELFRHHYSRRRTRSAMPRMTTDNSILMPKFPRITATAYGVTQADNGKLVENKHRQKKIAQA